MASANYDNSGIKVSPATMQEAVQLIVGGNPKAVGGLLGEVLDRLEDFADTMHDLRGSWYGAASDEAQDYVDRLNQSCDALFGTPGDPDGGIFPRVLVGLAGAEGNYAAAESYIRQMFAQFAALSGGGGGDSQQNVDNSGGSVVTAITETY